MQISGPITTLTRTINRETTRWLKKQTTFGVERINEKCVHKTTTKIKKKYEKSPRRKILPPIYTATLTHTDEHTQPLRYKHKHARW